MVTAVDRASCASGELARKGRGGARFRRSFFGCQAGHTEGSNGALSMRDLANMRKFSRLATTKTVLWHDVEWDVNY